MSKRISFWLAWLAWVLYLVITLFTELLTSKNAPSVLLSFLSIEYGVYSLITAPGSLPGGALVSLFGALGRSYGWYLIFQSTEMVGGFFISNVSPDEAD